jgi:hypothetical protein
VCQTTLVAGTVARAGSRRLAQAVRTWYSWSVAEPRADDDTNPAVVDAAAGTAATGASPSAATVPATAVEATRRRIPWWWILLGLMVVEFWVYGRRGYVEVCVGKQGETDFSLGDAPRTDENRWKFPRCEERTNLGLVSKYDDVVTEATSVACRGATIFRNQGQGKQCVAGEAGWQHRVLSRQTPPWDRAFYEHLFWFLK